MVMIGAAMIMTLMALVTSRHAGLGVSHSDQISCTQRAVEHGRCDADLTMAETDTHIDMDISA